MHACRSLGSGRGVFVPTALGLWASTASALLVGYATVSCQYAAGLERRRLDPELADGGVVEGAEASAPEGCTFPERGSARVRFGNMMTDSNRYHFCWSVQDGAAKDGAPVTSGHGHDCPAGLGYRDVLAPLSVPAGDIELRVVPADTSCSDAPVATTKTTIADHERTTVLLLGGHDAPPRIGVFPESTVTSLTTLVRFIHAAPGAGALDVGLASGEGSADSMGIVAYAGVPFGEVASPGDTPVGQVDDNGYLDIFVAGGDLDLGAAPAGSAQLLARLRRAYASARAYSLFAVGKGEEPNYPLSMVACSDDENNGWYTRCAEVGPVDVVFAALSIKLDGSFAPAPLERQPHVPDAVAASQADVLCVVDDFMPGDRERIVDAAKSRFPFAYMVHTDASTPIDDPRDASGQVPEPPKQPPCADAEMQQKVDALVECVVDSCSDVPGDPTKPVSDGFCLFGNCAVPAGALLTGTNEEKRCYGCLLYTVMGYESAEAVASLCKEEVTAGRPFLGENGSVLLSRYPLRDLEHHVLPSTVWRTVTLGATLVLPNESSVDVYCTNLETATRSTSTQPYYGSYGEGPCESGWMNEVMLQTARLEQWVQSRSGTRPAVILGEFDSGPGATKNGEATLAPSATPVFELLTDAYAPGAALDYEPACVRCASNPLVGGSPSSNAWTTHVFLKGLGVHDVRNSCVVFREPVVTADLGKGPTEIPVSPLYGFQSVVRIVH